jgi:hypothetical protein
VSPSSGSPTMVTAANRDAASSSMGRTLSPVVVGC